ncbi:mediator of RNA polymerase II transcription subunit 27-like [Tripterygium wilfordii]|uniref:Mediator of RNA polymerase II transcription subunit 27-like n=1 Tax=Tripterygium wilfordii TaxID=458696 RepID=A0A7J7DWP2_TRIWF|nr:mediator of RNA polymerase II transcription subunit 27 [Tripterygium wilfordii]KAF5750584.1 mediator of RNA polymerase II transcription subunit 27-like [Tripterygium wilfordii]
MMRFNSPLQQQQQQKQEPQQQEEAQAKPNPDPPPQSKTDAPPKQVAMALDRLGQAGRLIADVRLGADLLLEALFAAAEPHQINKPLHFFIKEDVSMRQRLQDLRSIGRQLEESGVLNESLRSRSNSWGLHMPLVCPDGAVVAYAWKRQLAGQAGASAVDRTRLALKAFTDQKRRFFPHLDDEQNKDDAESMSKKLHVSQVEPANQQEELGDCKTLSDILTRVEKEVPNLKIFTYERLDWLKRASSLPTSANDNSLEASDEHTFDSLNRLRFESQGTAGTDKVAVIELFFPSILRAIVSLHPAGSTNPDAVAFFSPDEGGSYIHARGSSVYHVFRPVTEHAALAQQYFLGSGTETALYYLLRWICSYESLFAKACSKCGRLLAMDRKSSLLLPPVRRCYQNFCNSKVLSAPLISSTGDRNSDELGAYHISCYTEHA